MCRPVHSLDRTTDQNHRVKALFGRADDKPPDAQQPEIIVADIESLHIDKDIWGDYALRFVPARWNDVSDLQKKAYMPFGNKPFTCPAQKVFGPKVIALAVGVLLAAFEEGSWDLDCDDLEVNKELDVGSRLAVGRGAYSDAVLRKRSV